MQRLPILATHNGAGQGEKRQIQKGHMQKQCMDTTTEKKEGKRTEKGVEENGK
jgi:hypothetical protein